tara:strand:- start:1721 stop:1945 length:225 start_codon:yes stop_codon:yes gene_type:complete
MDNGIQLTLEGELIRQGFEDVPEGMLSEPDEDMASPRMPRMPEASPNAEAVSITFTHIFKVWLRLLWSGRNWKE